MASTRRKSAAIALAVVGVAGLSLAAAAQLNVNSSSLGAGVDVVASCDDAVAVAFTNAYDATAGEYLTGSVTLSDVAAACNGLGLSITLAAADGTALATITGTAATGSTTYTLASAVGAEDIENVAVVIAG